MRSIKPACTRELYSLTRHGRKAEKKTKTETDKPRGNLASDLFNPDERTVRFLRYYLSAWLVNSFKTVSSSQSTDVSRSSSNAFVSSLSSSFSGTISFWVSAFACFESCG